MNTQLAYALPIKREYLIALALLLLWHLVQFFFLISNLTLPWHNLSLFPLIFSLETLQNRLIPTPLQPPFASPDFWNESSAGPQINPFKPPRHPVWLAEIQNLAFFFIFTATRSLFSPYVPSCLPRTLQSKQQTKQSQTPPSLCGLYGRNISFNCPILPPSTPDSAIRPAQNRQHLLPHLLRLGKLVLLAHRPSTSTSLFNKLNISSWIWSHRVHGPTRENIKSREHKNHKGAKEQQV